MSLPSAIADFYRRYARFDGHSTRPQFWWAFLYLAAAGSLLTLLFGLLGADTAALSIPLFTVSGQRSDNPVGSITATYHLTATLFWAAHLIPQLALITRRVHDAGFSRAWVLLGVIPLIGPLTLLILAASRSTLRTRTPPLLLICLEQRQEASSNSGRF